MLPPPAADDDAPIPRLGPAFPPLDPPVLDEPPELALLFAPGNEVRGESDSFDSESVPALSAQPLIMLAIKSDPEATAPTSMRVNIGKTSGAPESNARAAAVLPRLTACHDNQCQEVGRIGHRKTTRLVPRCASSRAAQREA
jgi:hypothetical protein